MNALALAVALTLGQTAGGAEPQKVAAVSRTTTPESVAIVAATLERIREAATVVGAKLQEARDTRDMVKLNCVNEKLAQITALLRLSEQADPLVREALLIRDAAAVDQQVSRVNVAGQKVDVLLAEADECIGQLAFRTDEDLLVEVVEPANLHPGDPTRPKEGAGPDARLPPSSPSETTIDPIQRPPPASPTE